MDLAGLLRGIDRYFGFYCASSLPHTRISMSASNLGDLSEYVSDVSSSAEMMNPTLNSEPHQPVDILCLETVLKPGTGL
jgi:hypothetical protein